MQEITTIELNGVSYGIFSYSEKLVKSPGTATKLLEISFGVHLLGQTWNDDFERMLTSKRIIKVRLKSGEKPVRMRAVPDERTFAENADAETILYHHFFTIREVERK